jgi:uncharacterized cysteine cluster protein YcgN (CxxCxxCC family)
LAALDATRDDRGLMERDSYWRTRTIAEAQSQGYTHLRVTCAGCGRITDMPLRMLLDRSPRVTPESFIGNLPLRRQKCGGLDGRMRCRQRCLPLEQERFLLRLSPEMFVRQLLWKRANLPARRRSK